MCIMQFFSIIIMKCMSLVSSLVIFLSFDVVIGEINYNLLLKRCKRSLLIPKR